jgi:hypothetical protein
MNMHYLCAEKEELRHWPKIFKKQNKYVILESFKIPHN